MRVLCVSLFIVIIDQVSKLLVKGINISSLNLKIAGMYPGQRIPVLGETFNITFIENPGIAFGIDFGAEYKLLISVFTIMATLGLLLYFFIVKDKSLTLRLSLAIIIGGAFGNLIDRVFYGYFYGYAPLLYGKVVDFFDFRIFNFFLFNKSFGNYIFNVADIAVTAGVILLLFNYHKHSADDLVKEPVLEECLVENKD